METNACWSRHLLAWHPGWVEGLCFGSQGTCILILAFYLLPIDTSDLSFSMWGGGTKKKTKTTTRKKSRWWNWNDFNIHLRCDCLWIPPLAQGHPQLVATETELEVIPSPSSRPFTQSCTHPRKPPSFSLLPQLLITMHLLAPLPCSQSTASSPPPTARTAGSAGKDSNGERQPGTLKGLLCPGTPLSEVVLKSGNELICIFPLKHAE